MGYEVRLRRTAQEGLEALPQRDYLRVSKTIDALAENARPPRVRKLTGSGFWRVRVGPYRVVYTIDDATRSITVVRVVRRKEDTYKDL